MDSIAAPFDSLRSSTQPAPALARVRVEGKFFYAGERKLFVKGVTYGPFAVGSHGAQFPERERVVQDFQLMIGMGVNTVRVFTPPPVWLLDLAAEAGLRMLAGIPWSQHIAFLDSAALQSEIIRTVTATARELKGHPAIFAFLIGNEIPPDMIRWHGAERVQHFMKQVYDAVKAIDPDALVSYANFPSSEYLALDFIDFQCFNVYLHEETAFRRYLARLHNLAFDKPLVLTEFGIDSMREGKDEQARILSWQVTAAFDMGVAGTFVFAWTDEWFTGGHLIENWDFGVVDRERQPKPAYNAVAAKYRHDLPPALARYPRVSVVVCSYNAERTMEDCLVSLEKLAYPDYEVIVVNDGSTDKTLEIAERFPYCRIISQPNKGLSVARNVGAEAATGEIVAYTDSDCVADPHWLNYLVGTMERKGLVACGGPNFPPPENSMVPAAVAVSPGGPTHVLLSDEIAEHIAGCNMAFRRDVLLGLGGFDPIYRAAGDDVDFCWRVQDAGYEIGYSPSAMVWHYRRNTVQAYFGQQKGYGKAEALVLAKHPARFNLFGQAKWAGRIYGDLSSVMFPSRRPFIYSGMFGRGMFQTLYSPPAPLLSYLPLTFEWNVLAMVLAAIGLVAGIAVDSAYLLLFLPLLTTWALCINGALKARIDKRFRGVKARALVAFLIYVGPILRGKERLKWRFKHKEARQELPLAGPVRRARWSLSRSAFFTAYWSERSDEKEALLGGLMRFFAPHRYRVRPDEGWQEWDLEISRGSWSHAQVMVVAENHGGEKRLVRLRCSLRPSRLAAWSVGIDVAAAVLCLVLGAPILAALIGIIGLALVGFIADRLLGLGRLVHRAVETVADEAGLKAIPARSASPRLA